MNITATTLEDLMSQLAAAAAASPEDFGDDEGEYMSEPPEAETLETAALRVSETLLQNAVDSYKQCFEVLKTAEINTLMAIHVAQKIETGNKSRRLRLARTLREQIVFVGEDIDARLESLMGVMEAAAEPQEDDTVH